MESGIVSWEHKGSVNLEQRCKSQGCHMGETPCELGSPHNSQDGKEGPLDHRSCAEMLWS